MNRHLAIFLPSLAGGGAEKVMLALAERFVARGIRCDLLIAMHKGPLLDRIPPGVRLVSFGKRKTNHAVPALVRYLRDDKPHTLLCSIFAANIVALIAGMMTPYALRVVLREANQTDLDIRGTSRAQHMLNQLACKFLYPRANAIIAVSSSVNAGLVNGCQVSDTLVHTIPNPAVIPLPATTQGDESREENLVLACGRLEPQKDHATLIRAFAKVLARQEAKLVILGEGTLLHALQQQARELGILDSVAFPGFTRNTELWMRKASVLAHPSRFEGMSNVLLEALACGCPIIASDSPGGNREVLANGQYGTLVPVGDDEAMAKAILDILKGDVHVPDASEHLRQFDLDAVADAYLDVLFPPARGFN